MTCVEPLFASNDVHLGEVPSRHVGINDAGTVVMRELLPTVFIVFAREPVINILIKQGQGNRWSAYSTTLGSES